MLKPLLTALALWAGPAHALQATLVGVFPWHEPSVHFGGLSGLELTADGNAFYALSDRGWLFAGKLIRTNGVITGASDITQAPLLDANGRRLGPGMTDSEGLALAPDGSLYISFEGGARVWHYRHAGGAATPLPDHPDFAKMERNASLEGLAIGPDGTLYTFPERSGRVDRPFNLYRFAHGRWTVPFAIPRRPPFLISGADIGPDGKLYVLERDYAGLGFRTRVRRFNLDGSGEETLLQTPVGEFDNLEGLSVWRDGTGAIRLTMVSDDNFLFLQQTQLVEYRVSD
ncbi:MAG: esterase-like activity of phytase family protein [Limimaricola sp.]|uniref:esterase-like activity of phytase family protein n=1 Tax=Limimaricola sp. TaxID=2211665 RepID=UPI001D97FDE6|nr:esterase-like activity of phytase family protein [Limimaricola sp.]MBI1418865.1 esterase-like activity of phytase family protein [Limimaricola sp.]